MSKVIESCVRSAIIALGIGVLLAARANAAGCLGDCNGDGKVGAGELTKIIAIIGLCSNAPPLGCPAIPGSDKQCTAADKNSDGRIGANELTNIIANVLHFPPNGCPATSPTPTLTLGVQATSTPTASNTVQPTATHTRTASPTPTPTLGAPVCGDGITQAGEDCDDGGVCTGGDNAGTPCTAESQCLGEGICSEGVKFGTACGGDADCPDAKCIHCKPFGGDGCAANCTFETNIAYDLVAGVPKACKGGTKDHQACTAVSDCPAAPAPSPTPRCATVTLCLGGAKDGQFCTSNPDCPGGTCLTQALPGTSNAFLHDGSLRLSLPLKGAQVLTIGKLRDGMIPGIIKASSVVLERIPVGLLACACVRAIATKTCGGTVFDMDGLGSTDCTDGYTDGPSVCTAAGKKPCAFVHGAGNSSSGLIGCNGLEGINLDFTQAAGGSPILSYPPAPTPPVGSGLPVITLSGSGGPGSSIVLNSSAIGTANGTCAQAGACVGGANKGKPCTNNAGCPLSTCAGVATDEISGPDHVYCSNVGTPQDDDPFTSRGVPQTLPQVTGTATGLITNTTASQEPHFCQNNAAKSCVKDADCGADGPCAFNIGPWAYTGHPYDCSKLTASPPTAEGGNVVGAFTGLNQPTTGDIVVRNSFIIGPRK